MDADIFDIVDAAAEKAGSNDPFEAAESEGYVISHLTGTIIGFAQKIGKTTAIAINDKLEEPWLSFGGWHEFAHGKLDHVMDPTFISTHVMDNGTFSTSVNYRKVARHEREANLVAAHRCIDTETVLDMIGYNSRWFREYREALRRQEQDNHHYESLRSEASPEASPWIKVKMQELRHQSKVTESIVAAIVDAYRDESYFMTFEQIAKELGTDERILLYKLESLRLRGYDIDPVEVATYSQMFKSVM